MVMGIDYQCAMCGDFCTSDRSNDEAIKEHEAIYPNIDISDCAIICDDCFKIVTRANEKMTSNRDFHEVWWIYSRSQEHWGGLRIAHFRKLSNGVLIVVIEDEVEHRKGLRTWSDIENREGWMKVSRIDIPTPAQIMEIWNKVMNDADKRSDG